MSTSDPGVQRRLGPKARVEVDLELEPGRSLEPVGRLVAAGIAGRLELTVDRILRLERAIDLALEDPGTVGVRSLRLTETADSLDVALGPLDARRAEARELERVLSLLVDDVTTRNAGPNEVWVDLRLPLNGRRETG